jgi:single-stranded-DNA-specific exonuclease
MSLNIKWIEKDKKKEEFVPTLAQDLNIDEFIAQLLCNRGITNFEEAKSFFRPNLDDLYDPFLMMDMEKAVKRIDQAIEKDEKILIFGDYDVDGTTATALMFQFLSQFTDKIEYYIPNRFKEGYGISEASIDYANEQKVGLIIALDCGIKSVDLVDKANDLNIDYIICDHHLPGDQIPKAIAVLNPKRKDCSYPFKELCGCGVGFKLAQAYCIYKDIDEQSVFQYLDLLTVAIAADMVEINDENRVLCYFGMQKLMTNPCIGLASLVVNLKYPEIKTISDIVFKIAPRINAAGRMESGNIIVQLLAEKDKEKALEIASSIEEKNTSRKELDSNITESALEMLLSDPKVESKNTTVVCDSGWHKGVVGIVASRLIEHYYRPTIVLCEKDGLITGSARSVGNFNIHGAIESCEHLLENFGDHHMAAGLTLKKENLEEFKKEFEKVVTETISPEDKIPKLFYDCEITLDQISEKNLNIIEQMRPFGPSNRTPKFYSKGLQNAGSRLLNGGHIKTQLKQKNTSFGGIAFGQGAETFALIEKHPVDVFYKFTWNEFRGTKSIQMEIEKIKP